MKPNYVRPTIIEFDKEGGLIEYFFDRMPPCLSFSYSPRNTASRANLMTRMAGLTYSHSGVSNSRYLLAAISGGLRPAYYTFISKICRNQPGNKLAGPRDSATLDLSPPEPSKIPRRTVFPSPPKAIADVERRNHNQLRTPVSNLGNNRRPRDRRGLFIAEGYRAISRPRSEVIPEEVYFCRNAFSAKTKFRSLNPLVKKGYAIRA